MELFVRTSRSTITGAIGAWWIGDDGRFFAADFERTSFDGFAYHEFGMIKVLIASGGFTLKWDVNSVCVKSLDSARHWLATLQDGAVIGLEQNLHGWYCTYGLTKDQALERINASTTYQGVELGNRSFVCTGDVSEIDAQVATVARAYKAWKETGATPFSRRPGISMTAPSSIGAAIGTAPSSTTASATGRRSPASWGAVGRGPSRGRGATASIGRRAAGG